jgi:hypothetical protein
MLHISLVAKGNHMNLFLKLPFCIKENFSIGMRRPVHPVQRGRTAVEGLICLGHLPSTSQWHTVIVILLSFCAGFSTCFMWLLFGY